MALDVRDTVAPEVLRLLRLAENRFKIGIVWSGNPHFVENHKRATGITPFLHLATVPGVQLFSLQKSPQEEDISSAGAEALVTKLGPYLHDFADTAAVLRRLDLVIMTDSSVAHLAGTIGSPVWNLLSFRPFWLYQSKRLDSPWYPSMRLFRQTRPGDWGSVFAEVFQELKLVVARSLPSRELQASGAIPARPRD